MSELALEGRRLSPLPFVCIYACMFTFVCVCFSVCLCYRPLSRFLSHSLSSFLLRRGENVLEFGFVLRWEVVFVWFPFGSMGLFV